MAGTRAGGKKSEATIKAKYGEDFYKKLGKMGGSAKGFASEKIDKNGLTGFQRAKVYGSVAGQISRRKAKINLKNLDSLTNEEGLGNASVGLEIA